MIYLLEYLGPRFALQTFSEFIPPLKAGLILALITAGFFAYLFTFASKWRPDFTNRYILLASSLSLLATYIISCNYYDEMFINLEHPFNLFHHNRFSFSPFRMIDGTVEFLYFVTLTPFAFTQGSLIIANFVLGYLIAYLHLWLLWKSLTHQHVLAKLTLLVAFTLFHPIITLFACGFGAGIISLLLLACIYLQFRNKFDHALLLSSVMPLFRPDSILYSLSVYFVHWRYKKRFRPWHWALLCFNFIIYFCFVKLTYGHWIPTPMLFKPSELSNILFHVEALYESAKTWIITDPFHFPIILVTLILTFYKRKDLKNPLLRLCYMYLIPIFTIFVFYAFMIIQDGYMFTQSLHRYWIGVELLSVLIPIYFLAQVWQIQPKNGKTRKISLSSVIVTSYLLICGFLYIKTTAHPLGPSRNQNHTNYFAKVGQILDQILPHHYTLATTELNSFAFNMDREVIDLWGYTNRAIASSRQINSGHVRVYPQFFLKTQPDAAFIWDLGFYHPERAYSYTELLLAHQDYFGNYYDVFKLYDLFIFLHDDVTFGLLVRKPLSSDFVKLMSAHQFRLKNVRSIDLAKLPAPNPQYAMA